MNLDSLTDQDRIALMEQAFSSVDELCGMLDDGDWDLPTDCPGWSVKDNLSHLVSYEAAALGRPPAPALTDRARFPWVKDEIQAGNEREVEWRRSRSGPEVLAEYREVVAERLAQLRGLDQTTRMSESDTPIGLKDIPWVR
ncbi:MAG TPA: maleylpyruvate isomerase N-terminal domain-containing protein, partial [Actinomycetota bacterium]|nr:maleylpyruvate isomerase N-terminal domain-containing protein [Actinomycetota bacterium]